MDDYMKEMMDLKTLVTKTLEKKGVLARIRAELRANVFQAIEEQDHMSENEGAESFALLGQCSERAKQLHTTPAGKLLTGLVCEYLEWCELDRTLKVYLPELNLSSPYSRSELEELLEIKSEKNVTEVSPEARPLLLEVLEGYMKSETTSVKDSFAVSSSNFPKSARKSNIGSKSITNGSEIGDEDLRGALESRLALANKVVGQMTSFPDTSIERCSGGPWYPEACSPSRDSAKSEIWKSCTPVVDRVSVTGLGDPHQNVDKLSGRLSFLGDLPPILGKRGGLAAMVLSNSSGRANSVLKPEKDNHKPCDVSTSGMQVSSGFGGGKESGCSLGSLKTEGPKQEDAGVRARTDDIATSCKEQSEQCSIFGECRTQRHWRQPDYDLDGGQEDKTPKLADTATTGTLGSTLMDQFMQHEQKEEKTSVTPSPPDFDQSMATGEGAFCVKTKSERLSAREQETTVHFLSSLDDKTNLSTAYGSGKKSVSAYFYSESDDDASIPLEEDFDEDSDGHTDLHL